MPKRRSGKQQPKRRAAAINALAGELVEAVFAADQAGDLTMANRDIARIDKALQLAMR